MPRRKKIISETPKKSDRFQAQLVRGMKDILPQDQGLWQALRDKARELGEAWGFGRIDLPILESTSLFERTVGATTDIVEKEMFSFIDKGGDSLTLRPEATASAARAYVEHGMLNLSQPVKLYYIGPMFRHERPQAGRFRQLHQIGYEIFGEAKPLVDAEIIILSWIFLQELGIDTQIQINSLACPDDREEYKRQLLDFLKPSKRFLCDDCQRRLVKNPFRVIDCKNENCQKIIANMPQMVDTLCGECKDHFSKILEYLEEVDVPFNLNPRIVRGLDYYTRTVFEVWPLEEETETSSVKTADVLGGGGRYDGLVELLGGQPTPGLGVALGMDRIVAKLRDKDITPVLRVKKPQVFLAQLGEGARKRALKLFADLRKTELRVQANFSKESLRNQLEIANRLEVKITLILGQKEVVDGTIIVRDMESGEQEVINQEKLISELEKRLA